MMDLPPSDDLAIDEVCTAASPIARVTSSAAPELLKRGDSNMTALTSSPQRWNQAFAARVPVRLVRIPGGGALLGFRRSR